MVYKYVLKMHVGKPAIPAVKAGEKIERGELIAKAAEGISANIHSAVTGIIKEVTTEAIFIEAAEKQSADYKKIKKTSNIAEAAFEAGIVGAGGAGFPTHVKLKTEIKDGVVFANCAECEPGLEHNIAFLEESPEILIKGIKYAMQSTKASKGVIGLKAKHKKTISILKDAIKKEFDISILELIDIYPVGEERALIHAYSENWLTPKQLPSAGNYAVFNAETLANIVYAVENQKPVIDKDITIVGDFKETDKHSVVLKNIAIGTPLKSLVQNLSPKYPLGEIIIGGPYTGKSSLIEDAYVTKMSGGFIFTIELPEFKDNVGLLVCACGANEERLRDIAAKMGSTVVDVGFCKNIDPETKKCLTPGDCPGQAQIVMQLKRSGAKRLIIANCSDCSNTVMCSAPALGLGVYHSTDHVFRTIGKELTRRLK